MNSTLRALNGFGLGARPGEGRRVGDPRGWLRAQLQGDAPVIHAPAGASPDTIAETVRAFRMVGQVDATTRTEPEERRQARQRARRALVAIAAAESRAALTERVTTERPFVERLVAFWSNHLCVSVDAKILVAPFAGSYEREAIRPHVLGRFEDMLIASATHPAMLVYLDNFQSVGPNSRGAQAARGGGQRARGLNENYARELLELHTLGVDGGYTQQDVQELAKILTGWTVAGLARAQQQMRALGNRRAARGGMAQASTDERLEFSFQGLRHEPGSKTVLGVRYTEDGIEEGRRAIRALARHPSTAKFVATKLVAHFVSDAPPASAVERIARVYRDTDGDLRAVSAALVDLPEAWTANARKFRTPQDWLVAVVRAFAAPDAGAASMPLLRQLRHPIWSPQAPKGFGDTTQEWADPDSLLNRAELARTIARRMKAQRIDQRILLDVVDVPAGDPLHTLLADNTIAPDERIALALAGPAFQWR
ncbi:MAG TPA: DUF1800 domain-containing protein [Vicinamibacterales bacterium]|nr:DUF1800 domain-containing protein [Vicinamibacterales bacterium]